MMNSSPFSSSTTDHRILDPCVMIIFGATGDLTQRKLLPALYSAKKKGELPSRFVCCGAARREWSRDDFIDSAHEALSPSDLPSWEAFAHDLDYCPCAFTEREGYLALKSHLEQIDKQRGIGGNRLFYLATQPRYFSTIVENLKQVELLGDEKATGSWSRVIVEKPFGRDIGSATQLQSELTLSLRESQLYRIDHYLGKETAQNILAFRFANSLFENMWNHRYVRQVELTVAESIGIEGRGAFYEEQGFIRDVLQNHVIQLLTLMAMEPPMNLTAGAIQDEKVKVVKAIRPFSEEMIRKNMVRGQYQAGYIEGQEVMGYSSEEGVNPSSSVETYAAMKMFIDNWRWEGVPFYLRGGKRLPKRTTEIAITFHAPPPVLFGVNKPLSPNVLIMRIQPNEGIAFNIACKQPGPGHSLQPVKMDFQYDAFFGLPSPDAYERLLCDAMAGDKTLFAREDEVLASWELFTPLLQQSGESAPLPYSAGSWGPEAADLLLETGHKWRRP
ncbi:MAG: glucose-6-phosphate dehydrogenase [Chlamydiota bacterium]|nr:glucose-6-phosphate dehydrogenase [Chlamydiota bacterium]